MPLLGVARQIQRRSERKTIGRRNGDIVGEDVVCYIAGHGRSQNLTGDSKCEIRPGRKVLVCKGDFQLAG